jgi:hypothetical protein
MKRYADLDLENGSRAVAKPDDERRNRMIRTLMMAGIASGVLFALIAEARLPPEQRAALFEAFYAYP